MRLVALLAAVGVAGFMLPGGSGSTGSAADCCSTQWGGTWNLTIPGFSADSLVLQQAGTRVTGTLTFTYRWNGVSGAVSLAGTATKTSQLNGTWSNSLPAVAGGFADASGTFGFAIRDAGTAYDISGAIDGNHTGEMLLSAWRQKSAAPPATTTTARTTTKPAPPASRPTVLAFAPSGYQHPGETVELWFTVKDASGKATAHATLFQDGAEVRRAVGTGTATGQKWSWKALLATNLKGPLYFCAWAENAAGAKSAGAPKSSCKFLKMEVPIARVSNGCGGEGWKTVVEWENYFGNSHSYVDSNIDPLATSYTVDFKPACDLHDAGYAGVTVADAINGGVIDFHDWTRFQVDHNFWHNMMELCDRKIPASATVARQKCHGYGSRYTPTSIGSEMLFSIVRSIGNSFFDADLTKPGLQETGPRDNS